MLAIAGAWFAGTSAMAAIVATSDDFSTDTATLPQWTDVGNSPTLVAYDGVSLGDYNDGDPDNKLEYAVGMELTGDGVKDDGGMRLNTQNAVPGDEAIGLTIAGTLEEGEEVSFSGSVYNDNTSYSKYNAQLWNLTDDRLLAESGFALVQSLPHVAYVPIDFDIAYVATADDVGDTLQIRFVEDANSTARDIYVDNFELSSVPLNPGTTKLVWNFNDGPDGTILTNNLAKYDYTSNQGYVGSNAVVNTLAFNGRSTGTDYIIRDKGAEHASTLYLKTINTLSDDFGIYIQKLDFTASGMNASNTTRVSWSFDILGFNQNGNLDPTNWTIKVQTGNNDPGINVSDAWFSSAVLAQTFSFLADTTGEKTADGTWTTVTGSYNIAVGSAGTFGGIQISTDGGGYTSAGGVFIDNLKITIASAEPVLDELFDTWVASYGLSGSPDADPGTDFDGDTLSNLEEYGLGGNPTNAADTGFSAITFPEAGDWLVYVYPQRHEAALAGLDYSTERTTDLALGPWVGTGIEVLGTGTDVFATGFDGVTNRISTATEAKQFIHLQINGL